MSGATTSPGQEASLETCTIKRLPEDQWVDAAARAIAINPANAPDTRILKRAFPHAVITNLHLALLTDRRWPKSGVTLTVGFLDNPNAALLAKVLYYMNAWNNTANVRFVEAKGTAQVRISRMQGKGNYSFLGTDILLEDKIKETMNLDYSVLTSESELQHIICHETGHTLGFPHEHLRPEIVERIDIDKAIAYYEKHYGWEIDQTVRDVLTPLCTSALIATAVPDTKSIMCYNLPAEIMKDGKEVTGGTEIDETDGKFAASVYPREAVSVGAVIGGSQDQHVLYRAHAPGTAHADGDIHELTCVWGRWSHRDVTADASGVAAVEGSSIAALRGAPYDARIYYLSSDDHVQEVGWIVRSRDPWGDGFSWNRDVTADAGAVAAVKGSPLAAIRGASWPRVYHLSADGHVHELAMSGSSSWSHRDVTADAGAVAAVKGSPLAAIIGASMDPRVYYLSADGHIHELAWLGSNWSHRDVTADAGAVVAMTGSPIAAIQIEHGLFDWEPHIYHKSADGHIRELAWSGGKWSHRDVTADASAVAAMETSPIAAMCQGYGSEPRVYYLTADGHIHELAWSGSKWSHRDVSRDASAVAATTGSGIVAMGIDEYSAPRIYYVSADGLVQELAWRGRWMQGPALGA